MQPASAAECTIAAAGDIAAADGDAESTAKLVESIAPTAVLTLGDNAYQSGTAEEYQQYYEPTWGRFKNITKPTPGNHEYDSGGDGYYSYFGVEPYYAFNVCGWLGLSLNSEEQIAEQVAFIDQQVKANPGVPVFGYWHKPRYSSADNHGNDESVQPLWEKLVEAKAQFVLSGHDHTYERFAAMDASGKAVEGGLTQFVIGTGGAPSYGFGDTQDNSEKQITNITGVGVFSLAPSSYTFEFLQSDGKVGDTGTVNFAAAGGAATQAPTAGATTQTPATQAPATQMPPVASGSTATQTPTKGGTNMPAMGSAGSGDTGAQTPSTGTTKPAMGTGTDTGTTTNAGNETSGGATGSTDTGAALGDVPVIQIVPDDKTKTKTTSPPTTKATETPATSTETKKPPLVKDGNVSGPSTVGDATWRSEKLPGATKKADPGTLQDITDSEPTDTGTTKSMPVHDGHKDDKRKAKTTENKPPPMAEPQPELAFTGADDVKLMAFSANLLLSLGFGILWARNRYRDRIDKAWV